LTNDLGDKYIVLPSLVAKLTTQQTKIGIHKNVDSIFPPFLSDQPHTNPQLVESEWKKKLKKYYQKPPNIDKYP
jgi:hypothetical protein